MIVFSMILKKAAAPLIKILSGSDLILVAANGMKVTYCEKQSPWTEASSDALQGDSTPPLMCIHVQRCDLHLNQFCKLFHHSG